MKNTLLFVVYSTPFLVFGSLALALLLDHLPHRIQGIFRTIYFVSYSVSVTAVAAIFAWLMRGNGGYLNNLLLKMGLIQKAVPWLEKQPYVWVALVAATLWWTIGYNMMLFVNALNEIDGNLYEAAQMDGAGFWAQLRYIILPNIKGVFFYVLMTTPIIMVINDTIMKQNQLGIGSAMTLLMGAVIAICSIGQYKMTQEKKELSET